MVWFEVFQKTPNVSMWIHLYTVWFQLKDGSTQQALAFFTCVLISRQCISINDFLSKVIHPALKVASKKNSKGTFMGYSSMTWYFRSSGICSGEHVPVHVIIFRYWSDHLVRIYYSQMVDFLGIFLILNLIGNRIYTFLHFMIQVECDDC